MTLPTLLTSSWRFLAPTSALRLAITLHNGQSFQWRLTRDAAGAEVFSGVVGSGPASTVVSLREHSGEVQYAVWAAAA